ncbi:MAG: molybdopterin-synthase adenylyltransferase MoeB [Actinomycetota bacterium]
MTTYSEMVAAARSRVREPLPAEVEGRLTRATVIDVREPDEFRSGTLPGAVFLPRGILESQIEQRVPDRGREIILFCAGGPRSILAAASLQEMGYSNVTSMAGGFNRWKDEGRTWVTPASLDGDQRTRYHRHLLLPEVGEEGQARLLDSSVAVVGAGGLGSPAAMYLAAAGIGTLGVVDFDAVDASNLQRQILHGIDRIGMPKVESARETLSALNPDTKIVTHPHRLSADNALEILSGYDLIVDGGDNFPTRYLVNDASLHLRTPVVHASIFRFEGQASVFRPYEGPCYRCIFPQPPPPEQAPSCAEAGVLGVLPGVLGSIQALEAIKVLLGIGDSLSGRLLIYDALEQDLQTVRVRRNPECPACGDPDRLPQLVDYDPSCAPAGYISRP